MSDDDMIAHFDSFAKEHIVDIKNKGKLIIAPNGSWFTQVPEKLRHHIYNFLEHNNISTLKYESRATLFNSEKAKEEFRIQYTRFYSTSEQVNLKVKEEALRLAKDLLRKNEKKYVRITDDIGGDKLIICNGL